MITSGIYSVTNTENDKVYVGSTIDFEGRWYNHRWELRRGTHGNPHLQNAWNKYGETAFEFGVLEYLDNLKELIKAEQFWMDIYREEGKELYNFGLAADNPFRGCHHTKESRQQMSKSAKNRPPMSKETRQKCGDATRGIPLSKEHCDKISASKMDHPVSEETRQKLREANLGKITPEEVKQKIRKSLLGRTITWGDKISVAQRGVKRGPISEEHRMKIRGENNGGAVLTEVLVRELRRRYKSEKITVAKLSEEFGINPTTAYDAIVSRSWKHVGA